MRERADAKLYVGTHPRKYRKSIVIAQPIGCVFIGTEAQCKEYIDKNSDREDTK
jgi:hypothetical protein